jgi:hypothetical protein
MAYAGNRLLYAMLMTSLDLELLLVVKHEPHGGSKFNPVERAHVSTNRALANCSFMTPEELEAAEAKRLTALQKKHIRRTGLQLAAQRIRW